MGPSGRQGERLSNRVRAPCLRNAGGAAPFPDEGPFWGGRGRRVDKGGAGRERRPRPSGRARAQAASCWSPPGPQAPEGRQRPKRKADAGPGRCDRPGPPSRPRKRLPSRQPDGGRTLKAGFPAPGASGSVGLAAYFWSRRTPASSGLAIIQLRRSPDSRVSPDVLKS